MLLSGRLGEISISGTYFCSKKFDLDDVVFWKKALHQKNRIEPLEGSFFQCTVVEIKTVDVEVGFHEGREKLEV